MSWFKVDDGFWSHPKTLALSAEAVALWVRAGSYACQHLTDGRVPGKALRLLGSVDAAEELVACGLWRHTDVTEHVTRDSHNTVTTDYEFHDWDQYQETSVDVKARRQNAAERQRRSRAKRAESAGQANGSNEDHENVTPSVTRDSHRESQHPDPTRPDHKETTTPNGVVEPPAAPKLRKRGTRMPPDWLPSEATRTQMREEFPHLDLKTVHAKFVDYWTSATGRNATKLDWDAAWRYWVRNESDRKPRAAAASSLTRREQKFLKSESAKTDPNESVIAHFTNHAQKAITP